MTQPYSTTPVNRSPGYVGINVVGVLRAIVSILETVAFFVSLVLAAMNNGADFKNAIITTFAGLVMHGVNHNAGGSPV